MILKDKFKKKKLKKKRLSYWMIKLKIIYIQLKNNQESKTNSTWVDMWN